MVVTLIGAERFSAMQIKEKFDEFEKHWLLIGLNRKQQLSWALCLKSESKIRRESFPLFYFNFSLALASASFSSPDNSYSEECFFTGLLKMLTWSREYMLETMTPSPSSDRNAVAKL